jgi:hypothetical protein
MNTTTKPQSAIISDDMLHSVISQIARYQLTTFAAAQQLETFEGHGFRFVKAALKECQNRKWIGSAWLDSSRKYWFLQRKGAEALGLAKTRTGPLSEPAKIRAAGLLFFCLLGKRQRHLLMPSECRQYLGGEQQGGLPSGYYFVPDESRWLGLARIDAGHAGRWDRVVQSVREDVDHHVQISTLQQLISRRSFEITIVTVLPQKAVRLRETVSRHPDLNRIPVKVVACTELLQLLATAPQKKGR